MGTKVGKGRPQMNKPNIPAGVILLGAIVSALSGVAATWAGLYGWSLAWTIALVAMVNAYRRRAAKEG